MTLKQFYGIALFQCPLKTDVFQKVKKKTSARKWVKDIFIKYVKVLIFILVT